MKILQSKKRNRITLLKEEIKILQNKIKNYEFIIQEHENEANRYRKAIVSMRKRLRKLKGQLKSLIKRSK